VTSHRAAVAPAGLVTVRNTLRLLQQFSYTEPVLGVSELARRLGLAKSTVHRMLSTLLDEGFVQKTADGRYRLGLRLYDLGQLVVNSLELREVAHPILERLRNETAETVHLAVLEGSHVVYVDRFESPSTLRLFGRLGRRMPAHCTSSGKCLLAFSPPDAVAAVLEDGLARVAPRTITSRQVLERALEQVRRNGYASSIDESEPGAASVGAPIFGHDGAVIAAVSVAGPSLRVTPESFPAYARMVQRAALAISVAMGHRDRQAG
jgi:IclR family KDG regulon transcriptional repressor